MGALGQCGSLSRLDLCYNEIGTETSEWLGGGLGQSSSLASVDLRYNRINFQRAAELSAAMAGSRIHAVW